MQTSPVARRRPVAAAVLGGLLLGSVVPALAAERVLAVTADGLAPGEPMIPPGAYAFTALRGQEPFDAAASPVPVPRGGEGGAALPREPGGSGASGSVPVTGDLPGPGSPRSLGLPAVLAAVLALGVASLLVRVLLAEPAARRAAVPS